MKDNIGEWVLIDGVVGASDQLKKLPWKDGEMAYEVLRLIDGVPLFFPDHYRRMRNSLRRLGHALELSSSEMKEQIDQLTKANQLKNCNVKIVVFHDEGQQRKIGYISASYYPKKEEIQGGVPVDLYALERENPNIKMLNMAYKEMTNRIKEERNVYEVLLVDRQDKINEGSISNLFFVSKTGDVRTAPGDKVLKGVTRNYVIKACQHCGYTVVEESVSVEELDQMNGAFLSGTSPKVLPISSIGDKPYKSATHPMIVAIRDAYDMLLWTYVAREKGTLQQEAD